MSKSERFRNLLLGLSVLSWAVLGLARAEPEARFTVVRLCISALNLSVGVLFLIRKPVRQDGSAVEITVALPSLLIGGWALNVAPPPADWPWHAQTLFALATAWAVFAFLTLGRSFAILPALRTVVVRGPFRLMRHPAYCGEMLLAMSCWLALPSWFTVAPLAASIPLIAARIMVEERLLMQTADYRAYAGRVPWRLLPLVW